MTTEYHVTEIQLAVALREWHRRWVENPTQYASWAESVAAKSAEYGDVAAATLIAMLKETGAL